MGRALGDARARRQAVRRRRRAAAAADGLRRGRLRRRAVQPRARGRLAAVSCATRARGSRQGALPRRRGGDRRLARGGVRRLGGIDRATYIAVLTHDPKLDDAALAIALRSDAAYVGAMGSRRAQEKRRERLLGAGDDRGGAGAPGGADRPRPRRARPGGDGAVDHGRGGGRAERPIRRAPARPQGGRIHEVGA